ncbi:hypothetical protein K469DRAFT_791569 [Zopfia rhizophila CBS 207.26]|uniref:Uncharacterized protein n=1 Tax=Zopfia rhizophila CBS 207.26 TaxID=1314779 RepID=A0A6A6DQL8_9PEZI|nr:hypothetical protein K469DRAFT_791569 [Zopfia rhizophila CBS 207.26]
MRYIGRTRKGRIAEKITTQYCNTTFNQMMLAIRLLANHTRSKSEIEQTKMLIDELVQLDGAITKTREQHIVCFVAVEDLLYFIWKCHEDDYHHSRYMTQVSFILLLLGFFGIRPGQAVKSNAHRLINRGLTYGETSFHLTWFNGIPQLQLFPISDRITFYNDTNPSRMYAWPVIHFIGLVLADGVFVHEQTAATFSPPNIHLPPSTGSYEFRIQEDKWQLTICRSLIRSGYVISPTSIVA